MTTQASLENKLSFIQEIVNAFEKKQKLKYISTEFQNKDISHFISTKKLIPLGLTTALSPAELPLNDIFHLVLSNEARKHAFELINELFTKRAYEYLELKIDYDFSYVILSKGRKLVKLIQTNENEFKALQSVRDVQATLLKALAYKAFSDPRQSLDLWEPYLGALEKERKKLTFQSIPPKPHLKDEYLDKIEQILLRNENTILVGAGAYEFLFHTIQPDKLPKGGIGGNPEFISFDVHTHLRELNEAFPEMEVKRDITALGGKFFRGYKYSISLGKQKLLDLYDGSQTCLPFVLYDRIAIGNLHVLLRFLYMGILLSHRLPTGEPLRKRLEAMANNLLWLKEKYQFHELLKTWQYLPENTKGTEMDVERNFRIRKWNGKIMEPLAIKSYKPEIEIQNIGELRQE